MQEFWATAYVHQCSIRFKMDNKKNIVDLEVFREMLHISPSVLGQSFDELPCEEEILDFLWFLRHSAQIKTLTDVNVNKLFQPWRSFAAVINKCLTGKSFGFDCFRLSQAQIFGTQESKEKQRDVLPKIHKSHHPSLHDKETFNPKTKQDIRNTKAYKEYYACATREAAPKPKACTRRKRSDSDTSITPPNATPTPITTVAAAPGLTATAKGKQPAKAKSPYDPLDTDEGTGSKPRVLDVPSDDLKKEISWNSSDDEDVDAQDKDKN
nr:hypothetical protein [Tanacetum cinerariifolium]